MHAVSAAGPYDVAGIDAPSIGVGETSIPPCACLAQALDLVKRLSGPWSSELSATLLENKRGVETVERLLACLWCAHDGFLLAVLAMAVLRVIERYAAVLQQKSHGETGIGEVRVIRKGADSSSSIFDNSSSNNNTGTAQSTSSSSTSSIISSSDSPVGSRSSRQTATSNPPCRGRGNGTESTPTHIGAAQQVLGELHRPQQVVNRLSPRLMAASETAGVTGIAGLHVAVPAPLSGFTLEQVEYDLRMSLHTLSADVIRALQES
jgi:hypothetical protein